MMELKLTATKILTVLSCSILLLLQSCSEHTNTAVDNSSDKTMLSLDSSVVKSEGFVKNTMNAAPFLPQDQSLKRISCPVPEATSNTHQTSAQVDYSEYEWEDRVAHDWNFFKTTPLKGRVLLIDIKQQNEQIAYRYLANNETQNQLYEPWSSSKIFAFTGAIAQLRKQHLRSQTGNTVEVAPDFAQGLIGQHHVADMITSINSYEAFAKADGNSNDLATFFANLATRDYLTSLFYDEWLKLSTPNIYFRGSYGPTSFEPDEFVWRSPSSELFFPFSMDNVGANDPGYLSYRCESCGLTGNKPMTTLAQAEWLKRLAMHNKDPITAHPLLLTSDINTLFYGVGHSQQPAQFAGMTLGISSMLQQAIAKHLYTGKLEMTPALAKTTLDNATQGQWRVFQKIGWGPSETRSSAENVVLAYVCLPNYQGGKAFVVAAQAEVAGAKEENVAFAGLKMQALLDDTMHEYLSVY